MTRILAKFFAITVLLIALIPAGPLHAESSVAYISSTGNDTNPCTAALPCKTVFAGFGSVVNNGGGGRVVCLTPVANVENNAYGGSGILELDCPNGAMLVNGGSGFMNMGPNLTMRFRNMTYTADGGRNAISVQGSGTLILENCVFEDFNSNYALDIEPTGPFNLVVRNSRISNNGAGVLLKPAAGGSVTATFNAVTIDGNSGGGLKTDTTNGPVSVDLSNSTISNNTGNGINAVSGAGGPNMLNIKNSVIARNGSAGVQANGASAAALVNNTLLDSNTAGATSAASGGRILTYGNNSIVGSAGSGFTGSAALQ